MATILATVSRPKLILCGSRPVSTGTMCRALFGPTVEILSPHSLPFIISDINRAPAVAGIVVAIELLVIAWVRHRFLHVSLHSSLAIVTLGGAIVLASARDRQRLNRWRLRPPA